MVRYHFRSIKMVFKVKYFLGVLLFLLNGGVIIAQQNKPNIIVILSDDAGYADFEKYGDKEIPTPNINKLSEEGVRFTNAYVTASVCAPSRAGLLTGRYQQRFGFEHNPSKMLAPGVATEEVGLDVKQKTIADYLKADGYRTIAIGKWHLGTLEKYFPTNRGFDEFYGFKEGHRDFFGIKGNRGDAYALYDNNTIVPEEKITYLTDMFTDKAVEFIDRNKAKPFFMYLAYNAVHTPLQAKDSDLAKFANVKDKDRRTYDAMMYSMDEGIGNVVAALKKNGIEKNTLIFFINDNGGATNNGSDNGGLRGMKGSKWEGGIKVAFVMKWPEQIPAGQVYQKPVSTLDVIPTSLRAAGDRTTYSSLDGVNLLPYLKHQRKTPHKDMFWRRGVAAAVRSGDWKLIRVETDPVLLFNLKTDPYETTNLASKYPGKVYRLFAKLNKWENELSKPLWYSSMGSVNQIKKHRMEVVGREMERELP